MGTTSLEGMYDLHVHPAPSMQKRTCTAVEAIRAASEERMAGLLFKDHVYNTVAMASTLNELGYPTKAFGGVMLNEAIGGLSPAVVEAALAMGTRLIEFPTYSSKGHWDAYGDDQKLFPYRKSIKPIYALDKAGRLIPAMEEIMRLVKEADAFIGSGHMSAVEASVVAKRARDIGCKVVMVGVSTDMPGYPLAAQKEWAWDHVFMEHCYGAITDMPHVPTPIETVVQQIRGVGAERCIISTDAGSVKLPKPVDAMRDFVERLLDAGISEREMDLMTRRNPAFLVGEL
jgi:hypothetical protein